MQLLRESGGGALEPLDLALDPRLGDPGGALHHRRPSSVSSVSSFSASPPSWRISSSRARSAASAAWRKLSGRSFVSWHQRLSTSLGSPGFVGPGTIPPAASSSHDRRDSRRRLATRASGANHSDRMNYSERMVDQAETASRPRAPLEPAAWVALGLLSLVWAWWAAKEGAYFGSSCSPARSCSASAPHCSSASRRGARASALPAADRRPRRAHRARLLGAALGASGARPRPGDRRRPAHPRLRALLRARRRALQPARAPDRLSLVPLAAPAPSPAIATSSRSRPAATRGSCSRSTARSTSRWATATPRPPSSRSRCSRRSGSPPIASSTGGCAARRSRPRPLCIDLFLLAQSRASIPAMAVALVVYALLSPHRVRALRWLALALLPRARDRAVAGLAVRGRRRRDRATPSTR